MVMFHENSTSHLNCKVNYITFHLKLEQYANTVCKQVSPNHVMFKINKKKKFILRTGKGCNLTILVFILLNSQAIIGNKNYQRLFFAVFGRNKS